MNCQISHLLCSLVLALSFFSTSALAAFDDIQRIYKLEPRLESMEICHGNGCSKLSTIGFTHKDWRVIEHVFASSADTAMQERTYIANAIGLMEEIVGKQIGTHADLAGTFNSLPGQMDCNDEAINTTTYLKLLQQFGYLRFHKIQDLATRNFFFNGWPHTTAVIREIATEVDYAVDSWFYDNGHAATVVPLTVWEDDYQPEDSPIGKR